jgi:hypothetical protein
MTCLSPFRLRFALFLLAIGLTVISPGLGLADVRIEGSLESVSVVSQSGTIADILSGFAAKFGVKYRSAVALNAASDDGYSGSFRRVVSRLLDGYSYVIKNEGETIEIVVFGRRGQFAVPPPAPKPTGILSRWR